MIEFEKWQGCRNDFLVVWVKNADRELWVKSLMRQSQRLCDRHVGVGADGLLILHYDEECLPNELTIINSDGSIAKNCGNGLRCCAASIQLSRAKSLETAEYVEPLTLMVAGREFSCQVFGQRACEFAKSVVAVDLALPVLAPSLSWHDEAKVKAQRILDSLGFAYDCLAFAEIGNPHIIIESEQSGPEALMQIGPSLQVLLDGINVHLVRTENVKNSDREQASKDFLVQAGRGGKLAALKTVWVYERGVGVTQACGSGACAVFAIDCASGLIQYNDWLGVQMPGGRLYVSQESAADSLRLVGPAELSFTGSVSI